MVAGVGRGDAVARSETVRQHRGRRARPASARGCRLQPLPGIPRVGFGGGSCSEGKGSALMNLQQVVFLVILAGALALFIRGRMRVDLVAMLVLLALAVTGILDLRQAMAGFGSEPAIIVAAAFVISAGLAATGVTDRIGQSIGRAAGSSEWRAVAVVMPAVAMLAAFSHHLMVTAMMLPILMRLARDQSMPASRLLMPMSLAASLGTTLTLFSAPAFLLARDLLERSGAGSLGIFSITPIGAVLVLLGVAYMLATRWLLPRRSGPCHRRRIPAPRALLHGAGRRRPIAVDRAVDCRLREPVRRPAAGGRLVAKRRARGAARGRGEPQRGRRAAGTRLARRDRVHQGRAGARPARGREVRRRARGREHGS